MVISGANAGGKTVVLKTAGLLSLMALSGLPVPAVSAQVPFYRSVLADIGDHQSLAANLSTFTSHVRNIASMIESCEAPALVLLDEVGTGTDPEEGSALGVAVVDQFKQRGAQVLATTHYSGLKMYAANEDGVLNASVEFDEKTLQPTYRLLVGLAGSSSGLEIARRFGIPDELIKRAAGYVKQSSLDAIEYLRRIKVEGEEAERLREALEEERAATAQKFASLDNQFQKRESQRQTEFESTLKKTVSEFERLSRELLAKIDDRVARVKVEREAEKRAAELKREAQRAVQAVSQRTKAPKPAVAANLPAQLRSVRVVRDGKLLSDAQASLKPATQSGPPPEPQEIPVSARQPRPGDKVRLRSFGTVGTVDRIKGNEAEVRVGSLHMREKLANLELVSDTAVPAVSDASRSLEEMQRRAATTELHLHSKSPDSKFQSATELNLIGKKTDEAVDLADKFLDEAFLNGVSEVRIIHGHGTGALRKAIAELLADHPHVAQFAKAPQDQGGAGATVVALKQ
jgi:DNA mismatch repair protein MutS2